MKKIALVAALAGLFAASAQADTITVSSVYGAGYANQTTNWGFFSGTDTPVTLSVAGFTAAGGSGTLNSVTVNYAGGFDSSGRVDSEDATQIDYDVSVNVNERFVLGGSAGNKTLNLSDTQSFTLAADDELGAADYAGSDSLSGLTWSKIGAGTYTFTSAADLAMFLGATYNVDTRANSGLTIFGSANLSSEINTAARARIDVTYNFDVPPPPSIPEPATLGLLGLGLLGLGAMRRRKA